MTESQERLIKMLERIEENYTMLYSSTIYILNYEDGKIYTVNKIYYL
jgi:uncharacterized protein YfkK (UPF0435 family)